VLALQRSAGNRAVVAILARDTWSKDYRTRKSRQGLTYEDYKKAIGTKGAESYAPEIKAASAWDGTPVAPIKLTRAELGAIVLFEGGDATAKVAHEKRLDDYLDFINDAFEAMGIDTVEAQSSFPRPRGRVGLVRADDRDRAEIGPRSAPTRRSSAAARSR
jgi:hypothetical protein